jgi:HPt (histidine-containing phosphotransfer) domain-containing protein
MVLKIFYESIESKNSEIEGYYSAEDWQNYTIKVHALKSSAKLIGAGKLAEDAQLLENAGKEQDIDYINAHHAQFMKEYTAFSDKLTPLFGEKKEEAEDTDKPLADEFLLESIYEGLRDASENMDYDTIEEIFKELEEYSLPENDAKKLSAIRDKAESFDYDSILELIES